MNPDLDVDGLENHAISSGTDTPLFLRKQILALVQEYRRLAPPPTKFYIGAKEWPGLTKLVEEAAEVTQVVAKLQATDGKVEHWSGAALDQCLNLELGDLLAAIQFVTRHCPLLNEDDIRRRAAQKLDLFEKWHVEQRAGVK